MKKMLLIGSMSAVLLMLSACNNQPAANTHTHEDGSTHSDHDTTKPNQEEFKIPDSTHKDSTGKEHTHADGKKHTD